MAYDPARVTLSYPKPRSTLQKIIPFARTDNATVKAVLPRDAVVTDIHVFQANNAVTAAGAVSVGLSGIGNTALVNAFSLPTTSVGLANPGAAIGTSFLTKLDADRAVTATYTVGSSTAGGTGWVIIDYFVAGPGETADD
jgi:hypothetical protein